MTDNNTITRQVDLRAPRERVWQAITQADLISKWFGTNTTIPNLTVGTEIAFEWAEENYTCRAIIDAVVPMTRFAYRWEHGDADLNQPIEEEVLTLVTFTLEDTETGTRLTVVETGFAHLPEGIGSYEANSDGWTDELGELADYLERVTA